MSNEPDDNESRGRLNELRLLSLMPLMEVKSGTRMAKGMQASMRDQRLAIGDIGAVI
jgi:hypothetical protein